MKHSFGRVMVIWVVLLGVAWEAFAAGRPPKKLRIEWIGIGGYYEGISQFPTVTTSTTTPGAGYTSSGGKSGTGKSFGVDVRAALIRKRFLDIEARVAGGYANITNSVVSVSTKTGYSETYDYALTGINYSLGPVAVLKLGPVGIGLGGGLEGWALSAKQKESSSWYGTTTQAPLYRGQTDGIGGSIFSEFQYRGENWLAALYGRGILNGPFENTTFFGLRVAYYFNPREL